MFDSWALAWICPVPVVRIWVESDLPSRTRKCLVSLGSDPRPLGECEAVLRSKDEYNRAMFLRRHGCLRQDPGRHRSRRTEDLATLDRYLATLRDLQRSGLRVNIRLGELFGAGFARRVLSRIIPSRIGHGVLLLNDAESVQLIREQDICLDMCPVSNTRLGVWDWTRSSPAAKAMRLGLPVSINSDDPVLFGAGLAANLALAELSTDQLEAARLTGNRYGYRRRQPE